MNTRGLIRLAAILAAPPAAALAQSPQSVPASITVVVQAPPLTLTKIQDFDYGTVYTNQGIIPSSSMNFARWDGTTVLNNTITIAFAIPTQLTGPGTVTFACGPLSAALKHGAVPPATFDPAVGHPGYTLSVDGNFIITLGEDLAPGGAGACVIDVTGATPGTYTGTVTLTVAVL
jgi:hypothetical protein